jgi:uncharacterized RDD family membrane protein YckC
VNQLPPKLPDLDFAPKWQRLIHFAVDSILAAVLGGLLLYGVLRLAVDSELLAPVYDYFMADQRHRGQRRVVESLLLGLPYYLIFEVGFGTTPAKWLTRTRVVTADGSRPTRLRLLGRTLCRYLPLDQLSFIFDTNGRGWHDIASGTYVVRRASLVATDPVPAA